MSRAPARFRTALAWLLTPVAAWAVSFLGAWLGARLIGGLVALLVGGVVGAAAGAWGALLLVYLVTPRPPDGPETP